MSFGYPQITAESEGCHFQFLAIPDSSGTVDQPSMKRRELPELRIRSTWKVDWT